MATNNQISETMEIDVKATPSSFEEENSSVNCPLSPITTISGWDDPLPSNPPAIWGIKPPTERVVVEYEINHDKVVNLHNKVMELESSTWDLPPNPSKTLFKKYQSWLKTKTHKKAELLAKAEKRVMAMRLLVDKKIKMDAEEMARAKEHEFLTYAWEKFHVFVAWSFPHYFEIIKIDDEGDPIAPVEA
ncbi:hypothetical protein RHSIM_Rhsim10G0117400 [Rhododendron simsii]|uniref:Uncharacterized protein n=1 Tax=Rhododendron simsii TaxID=118357 RepID=A0A834LBT3_RHOSS|nr:hypothetical protein RHSIM_Rhsim10G0117400 [Rhododendron simsii]